jgi:hypothetical protein
VVTRSPTANQQRAALDAAAVAAHGTTPAAASSIARWRISVPRSGRCNRPQGVCADGDHRECAQRGVDRQPREQRGGRQVGHDDECAGEPRAAQLDAQGCGRLRAPIARRAAQSISRMA